VLDRSAVEAHLTGWFLVAADVSDTLSTELTELPLELPDAQRSALEDTNASRNDSIAQTGQQQREVRHGAYHPHGRMLHRSFDASFVEQVRAHQDTEPYQKALRKRKVWVEPMFGGQAVAWAAADSTATPCEGEWRSRVDCGRTEPQTLAQPPWLGTPPRA
jgi:hypothetical protein